MNMKKLFALFCLLLCVFLVSSACADQIQVRIITFGRYEQDGNEENGPEPIEWVVLQEMGSMKLLISLKCLDARHFDKEGTPGSYANHIWEACSLREWLNDTFLNSAFTEEEQKAIRKTLVSNAKPDGYPDFDAYGSALIYDKLYLLSYKELVQYAGSIPVAQATPYALAKDKNAADFWLRSPGPDKASVLFLQSGGQLNVDSATFCTFGVRPVMTVLLPEDE